MGDRMYLLIVIVRFFYIYFCWRLEMVLNENWFYVSIRYLSVNEIYNIIYVIKSKVKKFDYELD